MIVVLKSFSVVLIAMLLMRLEPRPILRNTRRRVAISDAFSRGCDMASLTVWPSLLRPHASVLWQRTICD